MVLATQLSAVLHAGSRVTGHSFLNLHLCFSKIPEPIMFFKVRECNFAYR
jgi:hypothetical protein